MRLTKIVATLGPASRAPNVLRAMVRAGLDVARLNFSHGTPDDHRLTARRVRAAARAEGRTVALLQDLQGPRVRLGLLPGNSTTLSRGQIVELGGAELPTTVPRLLRQIEPGQRVLLRDGRIELRAERSRGGTVRCVVVRGGDVPTHAGKNLPDTRLDLAAFTTKDRRDLLLGAELRADAVALSFVRNAGEVEAVRRRCAALDWKPLLIAKIERREAIENLDALLRAADGVMVARGDLGVELGPEAVPLLQKKIVRRAIQSHAFVITATQMLESMLEEPAPTRAEVSDVANAVLDGTDAVMLSGETAIGAWPVEAISVMDRVVRRVEAECPFELAPEARPAAPADDFLYALSAAAVRLAEQSGASALIPFTTTGRTAEIIATYRPRMPILACTPDAATQGKLHFWRGVRPLVQRNHADLEHTFAAGITSAASAGLVRTGDAVVLIGGQAMQCGGSNMVKIVRVGARR